MRAKRPTIIDVAKEAGVSKSTAARALNGAENVTDAARQTVLKAAETVGYERNHLAVGMRSGRSGLIGLVIPDISHPFWADVARGAQDRVEAYGRSLVIFSSDWSIDREVAHLRSVRQARVEGIMLNRVADRTFDDRLTDIPLVMIGSSAAMFPDLPNVGSNIDQGVRLACDYLWRRGHKSPSLIVGPHARLAHGRFMAAIERFYAERGVDSSQFDVEEATYTDEAGYHASKRILSRNPRRPLAIFAVSDLLALGAMMAIRDTGLSCPEEVSVLGFDGIAAGRFSVPPLTAIQKPSRLIGERAVDMLIEEIEDRPGDRSLSLDCVLQERGSVADLGSKSGRMSVVA
ncbi:MAG: LacI family DNA-binding transcriptional regulator [Hyphomicrobiaceae bacterium]|nr:LacI family DNA-binding transcriptional regulator [Hyphomicrobiaceae bacterium]